MNAKKKIIYVVGTRPELIRSAKIIKRLYSDPDVKFSLVHTGQHYTYAMDQIFFEELGIPKPDINLNVGSGLHGEQTARIMMGFERYMLDTKPDLVAVFGDTNSSLAAALAATKIHVKVAHIEAGCREWEMDMPEEINRRLIDHCSDILFPVSRVGVSNLKKEHVPGKIANCGDPLYEVFREFRNESNKMDILSKYGLDKERYFLLTSHRAHNVDNLSKLKNIFINLSRFPDYKIIFPIHPRTRERIKQTSIQNIKNILIIDPVSYREILSLIQHSKLVITDSGGLQKEAYWCGVPCITLRDHTAWVETVEYGVNFLCKPEHKDLMRTIANTLKKYKNILKKFKIIRNPYVKKEISATIVNHLKSIA